jgi:uncharacterized protein YcbK (DUF882 family)
VQHYEKRTCQWFERPEKLVAMPDTRPRSIDRRRLLQWLAAGPAALTLGLRDARAIPDAGQLERLAFAPRELSLHNLHTGERLAVRYFDNGNYLPVALGQCNHLLRDHRSNQVASIDQRLFDQLHVLAVAAGREPRYEIISGYRSPASNAQLRASSKGVAERSLHTAGRAIDVRLAGVACSQLRDLALEQRQGGVGYYRRSDFVHLDTGRVRSWAG